MKEYLDLFRLGNGIIGIIGIAASAFVASGTGIVDHWVNVLLSCVIVVIFIAGGNSINDYIDRETDKVSHPERPIPSGRLRPEKALYAGISAMVIACILSFFLRDPVSIAIVIIAAILMISYEMVLKQRGLVGNITIAVLTGMIFLLGGSICNNLDRCVELAVMAGCVNIGREIVKDIEDMDGDKDRRTLPMSIGRKNAGIIAAAFFIIGPCLSIIPIVEGHFSNLYYAVLLADAMFIYAAFILFNDPHKSQKTAKYAMLVALVAFILGAI